MFAPGRYPPLYQQSNDPLLAYTKGIALSTAGIGYRALYTGQTVPLVAAISWGIVDLWRNANELVQFGNPTFGYWNNIIPYISLGAGQYFYGPLTTSCFWSGGNVFMAWVRLQNLAGPPPARYIASVNNNVNNWSWAFGVDPAGMSLYFGVSSNGVAVWQYFPSIPVGSVLTDWHFYAMIYNQGSIRLLFDDNLSEFVNPIIPWPPFAGTSVFRLGWNCQADMILPYWQGSNQPHSVSFVQGYYMATRPMFGKVT